MELQCKMSKFHYILIGMLLEGKVLTNRDMLYTKVLI